MIWLVALVVLLSLTAIVSWLVFYVQFCCSPEKHWKSEVLALLTTAKRRAHSENERLRRLGDERDDEARRSRDESFHAFLGSFSVSELECYSGIGPATVSKLRSSGHSDLSTLLHARLNIHGLGEKRLADIDHAVRDMVKKARSDFAAGNCRSAQVLVEKFDRLKTKYALLELHGRARTMAVRSVIDRLQAPVALATQVTFWRWFRPISNELLVPPEMMGAALPDLEATVQAADSHAARVWETEHRASSGSANEVESVLPVSPLPASTAKTKSPDFQRIRAEGRTASATRSLEPSKPTDAHLLLIELTIQFAYVVARADGPATSSERELIRQHILRRFSRDRALLNRAEAFSAHYEKAAIDHERCLEQIKQQFTVAHRAALMEFASRIVAASGKKGLAAEQFLSSLAQRLGVPMATPANPGPPTKPADPPLPSPLLPCNSGRAEPGQSVKPTAPLSPLASPSPTIAPAAVRRASTAQVTASSTPIPTSERRRDHVAPPVAREANAAAPVSQRPVVTPPAAQVKPTLVPSPVADLLAGPTREECLALLEIAPTIPLSVGLIRRQWNLLSTRLALEKAATMGPDFVKLAAGKLAAFRRAAETLLVPMGEPLESQPPAPPVADMRHNPDLDAAFGDL